MEASRPARSCKVCWLLAFVALLLLVIGTACGGGGAKGLSAEEYFKKLGAIADDTHAKGMTAQPSQTVAEGLSLDQQKQQAIDFLNAILRIYEGASTQLQDLKPPTELQGQHDALVNAVDIGVKTYRGFADEVKNIPASGISDYLKTKVFSQSTFEAFGRACSALQTAADGRNIHVNLRCTSNNIADVPTASSVLLPASLQPGV